MPQRPPRQPSWIKIPFRVVMFTVLFTLMMFSVSLLLSIVGLAIYSHTRGVPPNLPFAYKHIALPVAIVAGSIVLVLSLIMEIRYYRRSKVLAGIERAS
jgi:hypothetical protein